MKNYLTFLILLLFMGCSPRPTIQYKYIPVYIPYKQESEEVRQFREDVRKSTRMNREMFEFLMAGKLDLYEMQHGGKSIDWDALYKKLDSITGSNQ